MHVNGTLALIPQRQGLEWSRRSLDQGSRVSRRVAARLDREHAHAYAIRPGGRADAYAMDFSRSAQIGDADRVLGTILQELATLSDGFLLVDDDLARRGDPGLEGVSFVDDRVLRWADLRSDPDDLRRLIRTGASGYPLNAFVCGDRKGDAFRPLVESLTESDVDGIVSEVRVVIHSIHDAESFLLVVVDDGLNSVLESL